MKVIAVPESARFRLHDLNAVERMKTLTFRPHAIFLSLRRAKQQRSFRHHHFVEEKMTQRTRFTARLAQACIVALAAAGTAQAANLLTNPGFEAGDPGNGTESTDI